VTAGHLSETQERRTVDAFLGGRVTLIQPRKGHRAGLDAALLQALVPASAMGLAIDLGTGVGTVAFCLAARAPKLSVVGIERDAGLVACGGEALTLPQNASFGRRVRLVGAEIGGPQDLRSRTGITESADWVLMNPPFRAEGSGSVSSDRRRRDAHMASEGLLQSWLAAAEPLVQSGSMLGLIHRADALDEVILSLASRFGGIEIRPVHPSKSAAASRILVTARRASRAPLAILPGLILHQPDGTWTPHADAILRGEVELAT
jgi:tRNA1(Val) A37 N6-methylase TrmN6